ncbi:MAG TPA: hypothetical protein DCZ94_11060 [Lentisphaeria bacterium]|nr:MAG: hypothetical protein A2X48_06940 [Lentisphaerae bacterium GWF2_49_21]HBC87484.1 hypothetical protein [Lentisphaeria bacterium]
MKIKDRIKKYKYHLLGAIVIILVFAFPFTNLFVSYPENREPSQRFLAENAEAVKKNVPDVEFWITTDKSRYFIGEEIRIKLHFKSRAMGKYFIDNSTYDRSGRFNTSEYIIDGPEKGWADPLERWQYFSMGGGLGQGGSEDLTMADKDYSLNDYVRFDKLGTYHIYCKTSLVTTRQSPNMHMVSLPLKICVSEPRCLNTYLKSHIFGLMTCAPNDKIRAYSFKKLRYLSSHKAMHIFIKFVGTREAGGFESARGLVGSRDLEYTKKVMLSGLTTSDIEVSDGYLFTFGLVSLPQDMLDEMKKVLNGQSTAESLRWSFAFEKISESRNKAEMQCLDIMFENLKNYSGKKLADVCFLLLHDTHYEILFFNGTPRENKYAQDESLRRKIAVSFSLLNNNQKSDLLGESWQNISCKEFEPVLKDLIQDCKDKLAYNEKHESESFDERGMREILEFARIRLLQLQGKGKELREMIIEYMKKPSPDFNREILLSLKDETLPELDDILLQNIRKNMDGRASMLIRRYATSKILPDVVELLEKKLADKNNSSFDAGEILAYMMKYQKEETMKCLKESLVAGKEIRLRDLYILYPDETEEIYIDVIGELDDKKAGSMLLDMAREGTGRNLDGMLSEFEVLTKKHAEGFNESGEYKDYVGRGYFLLLLLQNKKMKFSQAQKDRLFSLLTTEEKKVFEELMQISEKL